MTVDVETRYGTMACLQGDSIVSRSLMVYGEWAQLEIDLMGQLVQSGATVADVGAFLGTHTLALARMVGSSGRVHSFEPRRDIRQILSANVKANALDQVMIHPFALGRSQSLIDIAAVQTGAEQNFGGLSITDASAGAGAMVETISIRTLDEMSLPQLDLLKVDAEGMEADVILGGQRTIEICRPVIFAECNDLANGATALSACLDLGYAVYGVVTPAFNAENFKGNLENFFGDAAEASLIAVPGERPQDSMAEIASGALVRIDSLDALSTLLLHKPQYLEEVLLNTPAGRLFVNQSAVASDKTRQVGLFNKLMMHDALTESVAELSARNEELALQTAAVLEDREKYKETVALLLQYRETSLRHLWERFRARLSRSSSGR